MAHLTDEDLIFLGIKKRPWNDTTVLNPDPAAPENADRFSLSAHFVGISCGGYNQDVMCNMAGKKGTGKSWGSLSLAYECSKRIAEIKGGQWSDYFSMDNVAIMNADKMIDILTSKDRNQVIISDDSGTIQGSRKFRSDDNQLMNDVFVVNRTLNNIYLSSAPESTMVDKQARSLPEHQLDFIKNEALLSKGYSIAKYFGKITNPKTSDSYYQYHYWKNEKVLRIIFSRPPKFLTDEYDKMREEGMHLKQQQLKEAKENREKKGNKTPLEAQQSERQKRVLAAQKYMREARANGMQEAAALKKMREDIGTGQSTWYSWKSKGYVI